MSRKSFALHFEILDPQCSFMQVHGHVFVCELHKGKAGHSFLVRY